MMRLSQVARKLNVGSHTIVEFLSGKGFDVDSSPNSKITGEQFAMLSREYADSASDKQEASELTIGVKKPESSAEPTAAPVSPPPVEDEEKILIRNVGTAPESEPEVIRSEGHKLQGFKVLGKIDLDSKPKPAVKQEEKAEVKKKEEPKPQKVETPTPPPPKKEEPKPQITEPVRAKEDEKKAPKVEVKETPKLTETPPEKKEPVPIPTEPKVEKAPETPEPKVVEKPKEEKPRPVQKPEKNIVRQDKPKEKEPNKPKKTEPIATKPTSPKPQKKQETKEAVKSPAESGKTEVIEAKADSLKGLTVLGKIELPTKKPKKEVKPIASSDANKDKKKKRPRKRIAPDQPQGQGQRQGGNQGGQHQQRDNRGGGRGDHRGGNRRGNQRNAPKPKEELTDKQIQEQIKATLAKLSGGGPGKGNQGNRAKYKKERRNAQAEALEEQLMKDEQEAKVLKVTEYISANDLASLMDVSVNDIISKCMELGMFVSINQRLDAETITVISDEFGFDAKFASGDEDLEVEVAKDTDEQLKDRPPIVTIMGHVDHGKTSLLDYIRDANVTASEAGGITQHIGAYNVKTNSGKEVSFLDTPGHEAFTAMRARGAKLTDVAIIVVAADDSVMPQTKEAINHAQLAEVPIVFAFNKIDKPGSNAEKIREELANMNILVEDWGGKYQCQEVSAKTGQGIDDLLEKVLLEAELLELKANPNKKANGSVIEAELDKGRGYVTTIMVQEGTLEIGDVLLAGSYFGRVKAMFDHRGNKVEKAGPATPVQMLGLDGAPQAGDKFNVMDSDKEAREIANKREQIQREQSIRTKKHITLDEIGRRLAIGNFKELNVIVKGDVDGSIEALSDSLLKLSTDEVAVNIIHKAVGQISESDVLLATASDAIIVGFQVRPSAGARKIAENEEIEIRLYSVIYDAINEIKDAMEGLLAPTVEEVITGNIEIREVFKISKVGTVAGCYVTDGYVKRSNKVRLIRDGIVTYEGEINQLKRFKDDVQEVKSGFECGISIKNFNDIKVGDVIEGFENREIKRTL